MYMTSENIHDESDMTQGAGEKEQGSGVAGQSGNPRDERTPYR